MIGLNETATIYDKDNKKLCVVRCRIISEKDITAAYDNVSPYIDWTLQIITDWEIPPLHFREQDKEAGQYKCEINGIKYLMQAITRRNANLMRQGNKKVSTLTLK